MVTLGRIRGDIGVERSKMLHTRSHNHVARLEVSLHYRSLKQSPTPSLRGADTVCDVSQVAVLRVVVPACARGTWPVACAIVNP